MSCSSALVSASLGRTIVRTIRGGDAIVRSIVPLPFGGWSIRMATGRLERADGRPLVDRPSRRFGALAADPAAPDGPPDPYAPLPVVRRVPAGTPIPPPHTFDAPRKVPDDPLPEARALLEAALKSSGP